MKARLAHMLVRLYPRPWRERYGAEFEALLETGPSGVRTSANVVCSALAERIHPTLPHGGPQMEASSRLQSWCARAPWAIFGLAPISLLAVAYSVALFLLWSGWQIFLPGVDTPFGHPNHGPVYGFENIYFQADKFFYFGAPVLVGWALALLAARQRMKPAWPAVGLLLLALMGATNRVQASRTAVPGGLGHIRMDFLLGAAGSGMYGGLLHASVILAFTLLPYLLWWKQKNHSLCA